MSTKKITNTIKRIPISDTRIKTKENKDELFKRLDLSLKDYLVSNGGRRENVTQ